VRAGIAEVTYGDACGIDALLVDQVVTGIVGSGERDTDALGRVAMAVDDERSARVLLEPKRDLVETGLVLVVDPGRIEREEDRSARHERRWRRRNLPT